MQICCALEVGTFFPEILQRMAIMGILSSIIPLLNSQTSNKHFELTREIFTNNTLSAVDSWRPCLHTRGKSIVRYLGMLHNYWKTLPSTKIGKTNSPSKNTAMRSKGYPIFLVKNDPVNIIGDNRRQSELRHFALNWAFLGFTDLKRAKYSFSSPSPPCNVVPMFELPIENNKHPNFEWRGQGKGVDSFVLWS